MIHNADARTSESIVRMNLSNFKWHFSFRIGEKL